MARRVGGTRVAASSWRRAAWRQRLRREQLSKSGKFGKVIVAALVAATVLTPLFAFGAPTPAKADVASPSTTPRDPYYFPETGHYLSGRFRQYWYDHGGLYVFGLPITKTYVEKSTDGNEYWTQYFERARFEYHPANQPEWRVLLGHLGRQAMEQDAR